MAKDKPEKHEVLPIPRDSNGRFLKGQSGNPKGKKPHDELVTPQVRTLLKGDPAAIEEKWIKAGKLTGARVTALALVKKMTQGDMAAIKEGLDRVNGKAVTPISADIDHSGTIKTEVTDADDARRALAERLNALSATDEAERIIAGTA